MGILAGVIQAAGSAQARTRAPHSGEGGNGFQFAVIVHGLDCRRLATIEVAGVGHQLRDLQALAAIGEPEHRPAIVEQLNREVNKALASADIQEYFGSRGFTLGGSSAAEFKAFVKVEADKWAKIVQASGAKPD